MPTMTTSPPRPPAPRTANVALPLVTPSPPGARQFFRSPPSSWGQAAQHWTNPAAFYTPSPSEYYSPVFSDIQALASFHPLPELRMPQPSRVLLDVTAAHLQASVASPPQFSPAHGPTEWGSHLPIQSPPGILQPPPRRPLLPPPRNQPTPRPPSPAREQTPIAIPGSPLPRALDMEYRNLLEYQPDSHITGRRSHRIYDDSDSEDDELEPFSPTALRSPTPAPLAGLSYQLGRSSLGDNLAADERHDQSAAPGLFNAGVWQGNSLVPQTSNDNAVPGPSTLQAFHPQNSHLAVNGPLAGPSREGFSPGNAFVHGAPSNQGFSQDGTGLRQHSHHNATPGPSNPTFFPYVPLWQATSTEAAGLRLPYPLPIEDIPLLLADPDNRAQETSQNNETQFGSFNPGLSQQNSLVRQTSNHSAPDPSNPSFSEQSPFVLQMSQRNATPGPSNQGFSQDNALIRQNSHRNATPGPSNLNAGNFQYHPALRSASAWGYATAGPSTGAPGMSARANEPRVIHSILKTSPNHVPRALRSASAAPPRPDSGGSAVPPRKWYTGTIFDEFSIFGGRPVEIPLRDEHIELVWPLRQQQGRPNRPGFISPCIKYDIARSPRESYGVLDIRVAGGLPTELAFDDIRMPVSSHMVMNTMLILAEHAPNGVIQLERAGPEGLRVLDVLEGIYQAYNTELPDIDEMTVEDQATLITAMQQRTQAPPGGPLSDEVRAMRRRGITHVDLLGVGRAFDGLSRKRKGWQLHFKDLQYNPRL
ncbi:hypothetical protein MIND_00804100 [Mycena indigotica]|uniref:DUF6699 domain-containing protein n=1 Tax=Mycena indigotica TaxID=2126181 RepID=A0A8H6VYA0_9AGAR|nr:uncharacterized protein MIND_00804100 [Mycena indigotica]KAF7298574.1 hypothetical protein MIND_00804100 [Mycena indigotica]